MSDGELRNKEEKVGAAVLAVIDRVQNHPRYALGSERRRRRSARRALATVTEAIAARSLIRRRHSRRRVAALAAAAYLFDRLARHAAAQKA